MIELLFLSFFSTRTLEMLVKHSVSMRHFEHVFGSYLRLEGGTVYFTDKEVSSERWGKRGMQESDPKGPYMTG